MLKLIDIAFLALHTGLILFNLFGWIWPRTRRLHLVSVVLILGSWIGLGFWYGFGYCPLTDWHWHVRERLGDTDLPYSYLQFLVTELTGLHVSGRAANTAAVLALTLVTLLSIYLNARDFMRLHKGRHDDPR